MTVIYTSAHIHELVATGEMALEYSARLCSYRSADLRSVSHAREDCHSGGAGNTQRKGYCSSRCRWVRLRGSLPGPHAPSLRTKLRSPWAIPSASKLRGAWRGSRSRSTIFSPSTVGKVETRTRRELPACWNARPPSFGRRFTEMSIAEITLIRDAIGPRLAPGSVKAWRSTPSIRQRTWPSASTSAPRPRHRGRPNKERAICSCLPLHTSARPTTSSQLRQ